jgi:Fe-S-cluster containining protein
MSGTIITGDAGACKKCGACCRWQGSPPVMPDELRAWPQELQDIWEAIFIVTGGARFDDELPCFFWDSINKTCRIYQVRPGICREFEPGGEGCTTWREKARLAQVQPLFQQEAEK